MLSEKLNVLGWRITIPQAVSAIVVGAYLSGFISLNTHLSKYGVFVFDLADSRYLLVGVLFFLFLLSWYFFAGRAIISVMKRIDEQIEFATKLDLGAIWYFAIFLNQWINIAFLTCLSAAFFSMLLLGNTEPIWLFVCLYVLFLIEYSLSSLNFDVRFPRMKQVFELVTRTAAILVFFKTIPITSPTMLVFVHFCLMSSCVNLVLDSFEKLGITRERFINATIYFTVIIILNSAPFGWMHYGNIKSAFGGGQLQEVKIIVVNQTISNGLKSMGFEVTPFLKGNLVHQNEQEFIVDVNGKIIRLANTAIGALEVLPAKEVGFIDRPIRMSNKNTPDNQESEQLE